MRWTHPTRRFWISGFPPGRPHESRFPNCAMSHPIRKQRFGIEGRYRSRYRRPFRNHAGKTWTIPCTTPSAAAGLDYLTQANQYHVILETGQQWQQSADSLPNLRIQIGAASQNLASTVALAGTNTALTGAAAQPQAPLGSLPSSLPFPFPSRLITRASSRWSLFPSI